MPAGFPMPGFYRQLTEGNLAFAQELLDASSKDLKSMLEGGERSDTFKPETDPVEIVIQHAKQVALCEAMLKLDDEFKAEAEAQDG